MPPGTGRGASSSPACGGGVRRDRRGGRRCSCGRASSPATGRRTGGKPQSSGRPTPASTSAASTLGVARSGSPRLVRKRSMRSHLRFRRMPQAHPGQQGLRSTCNHLHFRKMPQAHPGQQGLHSTCNHLHFRRIPQARPGLQRLRLPRNHQL